MRKHLKLFSIVICTLILIAAVLTACNSVAYGEWEITKAPTCTEAGTRIKVNIHDKKDIITEEIPALGHEWGNWEVVEEPTFDAEGSKKRECNACGAIETDLIEPLDAVYSITIKDGTKTVKIVRVEEDGVYALEPIEKVGYHFDGFKNGDQAFAANGAITESVTISCEYTLLETKTYAELAERAQGGADKIYITEDITLTGPVYVTGKTAIYTDAAHTLTRSGSYAHELFVIGEYENGDSVLDRGGAAELTLKTVEGGTLTIDGAKDSIVADGSAFFIVNSSKLIMNDGVTICNLKKMSNEKLINGKYGEDKDDDQVDEYRISYPRKVGGAAIVVVNGTFIMNGGLISNCEVNIQDAKDQNQPESEANYADSSCGGAIYNYGTIEMNGGTIENSVAARGGAVYNYRIMRVSQGLIQDNEAKVYAGAIYLPGSQYAYLYFGDIPTEETTAADLETIKVTIKNNKSGKSGGSLFGQTKNSIIVYGNTKFEGNEADGNGGAISTSGALLVNYAEFEGNKAQSKGGAIYAYYSNEELTGRFVEISAGKFINNEGTKGGAVAFSASSTEFELGKESRIANAIFSGNIAHKTEVEDTELPDGGGDESGTAEAEGDPEEVTYYNGNGGAIYLSRKSSLIVDGCVFDNNSAERKGGAVYVTGESTLTVSKIEVADDDDIISVFQTNKADGNGGAIYGYENSTIVLNDVELKNNVSRSDTYGGGAVYCSSTTATITNCTITGHVNVYHGGAIAAYSGSNVSVVGGSIKNNGAQIGAALYASGSTVTMNGTEIANNTSVANGGAVGAYSCSNVTFTNCTFSGNTATDAESNGGAIYVVGPKAEDYTTGDPVATVTCNNCTFDQNTVGKRGGAISAVRNGKIVVNDSTFTSNSAPGAGAIYLTSAASAEINDSTFSGNTTSGNGGAIYCYTNSTAVLSGIVVKNNTATGNGAGLYVSDSAKVTIQGSQRQAGTADDEPATDTPNSIVGNTAAQGAGIYVTTAGTVLRVNGTLFKGNITNGAKAGGSGLAINTSAVVYLTDVTFEENEANGTEGYGGALYATGASKTYMTNVTATSNLAKSGGAFYVTKTDTELWIYSAECKGNAATGQGSTMHINTTKVKLYYNEDGSFNYDGTITVNSNGAIPRKDIPTA